MFYLFLFWWYLLNQTKSGQQLCSIKSIFDLMERSPKWSGTKAQWIVKIRIVKRTTCFECKSLWNSKCFKCFQKGKRKWTQSFFFIIHRYLELMVLTNNLLEWMIWEILAEQICKTIIYNLMALSVNVSLLFL